ncbi:MULTISPECIES: ATP-binding protein [unclassified Streptomyces]|uniref:ATP-binding protein n=1 Tax=unclassified Streptomyces TaxID=2593676 RepID=UPI00136D1FC4|nr:MULTISPECIES: ATP-binding protein [unclassified Streptomyces]NEA01799.1 ATP-binding protein [Streptomyces sp. SID10116]MYY85380.1 ATP-binding protein [Streptomyces sp. SID335]MYZ18298.1 ATP-binding protein [Streptomyces sp. SID337]NDZ87802.1 ATP-binding protein [Streptomyces sp. SID10115]NEB48934.1 ATP-binding protein [Streptomyces sp. SID339]
MRTATVSPPWSYTLRLPHDPRAPGIGRATLRAVLETYGLGDLTPTAELLAGELLNNAHCHTDGPYALRLRSSSPEGIRVAVWDSNPQIPPGFGKADGGVDSRPPEMAENGRGLHIVRACADRWGSYAMGTGNAGKLLWAEVTPGAGR